MEYPIFPSTPFMRITSSVIALLSIIVAVLFLWIAYTGSNLQVFLDKNEINIKIPIYGRKLPIQDIELSSLKLVKLTDNSEYRPSLRTNGIGLPSYSIGWFKLRNGEKALCAITVNDSVVYARTDENYSLLLSVKNAEKFLREVRSMHPDQA